MRPASILLLTLALLLAACGGDDGGDDSAGSDTAGATITIEDFSFGEPVTVSTGEQVTVVNQDGVTHTWTATDDTFDSGNLSQGEESTFTFEEPGTYQFFCKIHPTQMAGTITVEG